MSKSKLSLWVALSSLPGMVMMSSSLGVPTLGTACSLAFGTFLSSACANCMNQILEKDLDGRMMRTKNRPVVSGRVDFRDAKIFSAVTGVLGIGILAIGTNPVTASLATLNLALYVLAYTPLKVITPYNTHVGSIVGSIPVLMGCTAAGSNLLSPHPWLLFAIQTCWQFPHFYALAWLHREDYIKGGYRMFPLADSTGRLTAQMIKPYMWTFMAIPLIAASCGWTSYMFAIDSLLPNAIIYSYFRQFERNPDRESIRRFFLHSLWHLFVLLLLTVYHSFTHYTNEETKPSLQSKAEAHCPHMRLRGFDQECPISAAAMLVARGKCGSLASGSSLVSVPSEVDVEKQGHRVNVSLEDACNEDKG